VGSLSLIDLASLAGTFVFAVSGALKGVEKRFDLLGVIVLGCVTAVGGGSIRDTLTGHTPPLFFRDERYLWVAIWASLTGFVFYGRLGRLERVLQVFDSLGLALFAATGASLGLDLGLGPLGVIFVGAISGVGGGVVRDLLAGEVPFILYRRDEIYATAAAAGSLALYLSAPSLGGDGALVLAVAVTLALRLASRRLGIALPVRFPGENLVLGSRREGSTTMNSAPILEGQPAPDFTLEAHTGEQVTLSQYRGKSKVLLIFYPLDFTRVCTIQLPEFSGQADLFEEAGTAVLGISRDSVNTHEAWAREYGIEVPLLADMTGTVSRLYGVWIEEKAYSKRATFLIDEEGIVRIAHVEDEIGDYTLHAMDVLERLKTLT
jgi:uncharacterized membrane protein YeiH/peroxiredoxin